MNTPAPDPIQNTSAPPADSSRPPYLLTASIGAGLWGWGVAYQEVTGPCPDVDELCEGSMADPFIVVGFGLLAVLVAVSWSAMFLLARRVISELPNRSTWLPTALAAGWWIPPTAITWHLEPGIWSAVPVIIGVLWALLSSGEHRRAATPAPS